MNNPAVAAALASIKAKVEQDAKNAKPKAPRRSTADGAGRGRGRGRAKTREGAADAGPATRAPTPPAPGGGPSGALVGGPIKSAALQQAQEDKKVQQQQQAEFNRTQGAPTGKVLKGVIDILREHQERALPLQELNDLIGFDLGNRGDVLFALRENEKVSFMEQMDSITLQYKPRVPICSKSELLQYIQKHKMGIEEKEIEDAYRSVQRDLTALAREGLIIMIRSQEIEPPGNMLYPVQPSLQACQIDEDIVTACLAIELPADASKLDKELEDAGLKHALRKARPKITLEKEKKKRKVAAPRAVTNTHLQHLFDPANVRESID